MSVAAHTVDLFDYECLIVYRPRCGRHLVTKS